MALQPTTLKVEINLSDLDRNVYSNQRFTLAQQPSETAERVCARLLATALWFSEALKFGRGLGFPDEPALLEESLDGQLLHWIDVGQPDLERITASSRKALQVSILAYGGLKSWPDKVVAKLGKLANVKIAHLEPEPLAALAETLTRSVQWSVLISEGVLYITTQDQQFSIQLQWLKGD